MNDNRLHDIFHSYHPEMSSDEDFMACLTKQMDAIDQQQAKPAVKPLYRKVIPWLSGIAAAMVIALVINKATEPNSSFAEREADSRDFYMAQATAHSLRGELGVGSSFEETVAEIERSGQQLQREIEEMKK